MNADTATISLIVTRLEFMRTHPQMYLGAIDVDAANHFV